MWLPVVRTWHSSDRNYCQAWRDPEKNWRCSYDAPPPLMEPDHPFYSNIKEIPQIKEGKWVQIVAHGNNLLDILNLPTSIPMVYELDKNFKPIKTRQFLGDEENMGKVTEAVAAQSKAKK
ncbi:unnamed protein product [Nyctereutes procyonoides]|uniref:(raccoon dog) hypothetical protein n=1 Tax=Nyctereutes procyonoides TaxID=34880 RepID=A0A811Y560_NYCPR|nr:unnamed protein product [Nyctereutes procyonoides]